MQRKLEIERKREEEVKLRQTESSIKERDDVEQKQRQMEEMELKEQENFKMRKYEIDSILKISRDKLADYDQYLIVKAGKLDDIQRKVDRIKLKLG